MAAFLLIPWGRSERSVWKWEVFQSRLQPPGSQAVWEVLEPRPGEVGGPWSEWGHHPQRLSWWPEWRTGVSPAGVQHSMGWAFSFASPKAWSPWYPFFTQMLLGVGPHPEMPRAPLHRPPWHLTSSAAHWLGYTGTSPGKTSMMKLQVRNFK